jgi:hypothetical protein
MYEAIKPIFVVMLETVFRQQTSQAAIKPIFVVS